MPQDVGTWVGVLGFFFAVAASLGAAVGIFRANLAKATIQAQKDRIDILERELSDRTTRLSEAEVKIEHQATEIGALSRLATGEAALAAITKQIDDHHTAAMVKLAEILQRMADR
jgi:hypothetical protein